MKSFYTVIDTIRRVIKAEPFNHEVTFGDIADVDLKKQSLYPLCHITVNNATIQDNYVIHNMTIFLMDLVDVSNEQTRDYFLGNDNRQDILNTQLALATRIIRVLQKKDTYRNGFELVGNANCEPFLERFDNVLAGWAVTFDIGTTTEMTYC